MSKPESQIKYDGAAIAPEVDDTTGGRGNPSRPAGLEGIVARNLSFRYDRGLVLDDVTISARPGTFLGIVGPNGAGKSTLLKILDRIAQPERGSVHVNGRPLETMKRAEIARTIGYIPQAEHSTFPTTVFDAILMGRKPHFGWQPRDEDLRVTARVIAELSLEDLALRDINQMSGGQRQKVIFGRALAQDPTVFLLDEPTANLDLRHQLETLQRLARLADRGKIVIVAIHDLNLALKFCTQFVLLHEGRVYAAGGPEILTPEHIEAVYGVRVTMFTHAGAPCVVPESPIDRATEENENER